MLSHERLIALDGAHNVRDLGGYPTGDGGATRWRSILRGDALHALSAADIDTLVDQGLKTVIDLRSPSEISAEANPFAKQAGVHYHNTPLFSAMAPLEMMAEAAPDFDMGRRYCSALDECQPAIAEVLRTIARAQDGIVLFHCSAGKDRTGLIAALLLLNAGVGETAIIEDYALTGTISGPLITLLRLRAIARGMAPAIVDVVLASEPASMRRMLAYLAESYGGVGQYLSQIGLDGDDVLSLKRRIVEL
jgi:protein-tyrosine phosphatase